MKLNLAKKIVCGLTLGSFFLSFGGLALAQDAPNDAIHRPSPCNPPPATMPNPGDMRQHVNKVLDKLVNQGTLTRDQADKVLYFFKEKDKERKNDMEVMKDMTPEDREAYLHEKFNKRPDFIKELQNAADLSDEQAKTVADAIRPPHRPNPNGPEGPMMPHP